MSLLIALLRLMRGLKKLGASKKSSFSKELLSARWSQLEQAVPVRVCRVFVCAPPLGASRELPRGRGCGIQHRAGHYGFMLCFD